MTGKRTDKLPLPALVPPGIPQEKFFREKEFQQILAASKLPLQEGMSLEDLYTRLRACGTAFMMAWDEQSVPRESVFSAYRDVRDKIRALLGSMISAGLMSADDDPIFLTRGRDHFLRTIDLLKAESRLEPDFFFDDLRLKLMEFNIIATEAVENMESKEGFSAVSEFLGFRKSGGDDARYVLVAALMRVYREAFGRDAHVSADDANDGGPFRRFYDTYAHHLFRWLKMQFPDRDSEALRNSLLPTRAGLRNTVRKIQASDP